MATVILTRLQSWVGGNMMKNFKYDEETNMLEDLLEMGQQNGIVCLKTWRAGFESLYTKSCQIRKDRKKYNNSIMCKVHGKTKHEYNSLL